MRILNSHQSAGSTCISSRASKITSSLFDSFIINSSSICMWHLGRLFDLFPISCPVLRGSGQYWHSFHLHEMQVLQWDCMLSDSKVIVWIRLWRLSKFSSQLFGFKAALTVSYSVSQNPNWSRTYYLLIILHTKLSKVLFKIRQVSKLKIWLVGGAHVMHLGLNIIMYTRKVAYFTSFENRRHLPLEIKASLRKPERMGGSVFRLVLIY